MSRFDSFIKGLTSPLTGDAGGERLTEREKRHRKRSERRRRYNSPDRAEKGGDVDRRGSANAKVADAVVGDDAAGKPYDPDFLRDISANAVVQAYIDTLSQDVAGADWKIVTRDEDADVDNAKLDKVERKLKSLPAGDYTFRDVREATTRVLLELGDATWLKFYREDSDKLAEILPVDSSTMFKKVDTHGITEGYIQVPREAKTRADAVPFKPREVVWFEWSSRPDRHYGQGPLEKAQNEVELLEELAEKERLDLMQGSPPGVISPAALDEFGGLPNEEDWDTFVEKFRLDEGERHRVGYSRYPVDFEPISPNYQELQILDRSKYWVTVLGAVFKCNPSYVGFDFENTNRATDETQQEAYSQRGFRITLRQVEEAINQGLIWSEFSDDIKFEFVREQTVSEKKTQAELIETQANAAKEMSNAGRDVAYRDGQIVVEDGDIEEGNVGSSGGGGGLFGASVDEDDGDTDFSAGDDVGKANLSKDEVAKLDDVLLTAHYRQIQPATLDDIEKAAWSGDESVPDYVIDKIEDVINNGAVFDEFESLPGRVQSKVEDILGDALTNPNGWSLDSIVDNLSDAFPGVEEGSLETVARTESASVLNRAREEGYQDRPDSNEYLFKWVGPSDSRTTDACEDLKERTNPDFGGEPRPLNELIQLEEDVHDEYFPNLRFRKHTVHINERHTFARDTSFDADVDVDVPTAEEMNERFEDTGGEDFDVPPAKSKSCDHDVDVAEYAGIVKEMAKDLSRSSRERQLEDALGESMPGVLRDVLRDSGGSKRPALRALNGRLEENDDYDHEQYGKVSPNTFYAWVDTYQDHLTDVV